MQQHEGVAAHFGVQRRCTHGGGRAGERQALDQLGHFGSTQPRQVDHLQGRRAGAPGLHQRV
jgi:hypothetical protein